MSVTKLPLIPTPKEVSGDEEKYVLVASKITATDARFEAAVKSFSEYVRRVCAAELELADGGISLSVDSSLAEGEYRICISDTGAEVTASEPCGANYACATLLQLLRFEQGRLLLPLVDICDRPECSYRALMVDLARQWHPFPTLFEYVDLCYLYKVNFLHLHFIDTQSYTLPSVLLPKAPTEGRHYTREQIAELNDYAAARGVELIPEIEVPGHSAAMVNAYPELFANTLETENVTDTYSLFNNTQKRNIICVGKPGIMDTLCALAKEVIEMFPNSRYLHIGGDEAKIAEWECCTDCKRYMKKHGINGAKPLYTHFVKLMTDTVLELGKTPIVWEGFPREGSEEISRDVVVTAWESYYHLADELVEEGFNIINASWEPLYTVPAGHRVVKSGRWQPEQILEWNVYTWKNWNKKSPAHLNPIHLRPTNRVLGGQFCAWENSYDNEIGVIRENLPALAERTWTILRLLEDDEFRKKLDGTMIIAGKLSI